RSPEEKAAVRQAEAKSIFDDLEAWLHAQLPRLSGKTPLAQAIRYALGRMPKARPCLANGHLSLDTDVVEQPLFHVSLGLGGLSRQASTIFA
ncbi:MAG: transposase, partial [Pseudomonadota bacterium]